MRLSLNARRSLAATALLAFASACGSDATAPKPAFTVEEATAIAMGMFVEVSNAMTQSGFGADLAPSSARFSSVPFTTSDNFTSSCTKGGSISGTVAFTGDIDVQGGGTASGTVTTTPQGCRIDTGKRIIALGGQMTYTFNMKFSQNAALDNFDWRGAGNFTWDGNTCGIDYTLKLTGIGIGNGTLTGSVCGVDISRTL